MLIFSVSFQFYRMRQVLPCSEETGNSIDFAKKDSQREARTLDLSVNSRLRCQLRHPGSDSNNGHQTPAN
jgi:hypothetical protein